MISGGLGFPVGPGFRAGVGREIGVSLLAVESGGEAGVEMLAWRCNVNLGGIEITAPVPIVDG